jgi:hypothetical protein
MAEYELVAFRDDKAESVASMWFGQRPDDEWVYKLAAEAGFGNLINTGTVHGNRAINFDNGYIEVRKHTNSAKLPPAKKRKT